MTIRDSIFEILTAKPFPDQHGFTNNLNYQLEKLVELFTNYALEEAKIATENTTEQTLQDFMDWFNENNDREYWLHEKDIEEFLTSNKLKRKA